MLAFSHFIVENVDCIIIHHKVKDKVKIMAPILGHLWSQRQKVINQSIPKCLGGDFSEMDLSKVEL